MSINFTEYSGSRIVEFTSDYGPTHECIVDKYITVQDKLVLATWATNKIPYTHNKISYYLYEGYSHPSKSEYIYFPLPGGAGMVLKPHVRARLGVKDVTKLLT